MEREKIIMLKLLCSWDFPDVGESGPGWRYPAVVVQFRPPLEMAVGSRGSLA